MGSFSSKPQGSGSGLPEAFFTSGGSSFTDLLARTAPELLPTGRALPAGSAADLAPHGTTIVSVTFDGGVVMAGDRRATMGNMIAQRDIDKVHQADAYSCVGIAGTAGLGLELIRLFQVELEHYEKIEGSALSLEGKANRLAAMVRGNLGAAMQGLAVVPLFAGFDLDAADPVNAGHIYSYDVTGGRYEEHSFYSIGSGSVFARGSLKKRYRNALAADDAIAICVEALYDAADDDSATGGPDMIRRIFPTVSVVSAQGYQRVEQSVVGDVVEAVLTERRENPGG